jgi:hypothetical protein
MKNQICSSRSLFRPPRPIARLADPNLNENSPRNGSNSSKSLRNATKQRAQRLQTIHIVAQSIPLTPASRLLDTLIVAHRNSEQLRNGREGHLIGHRTFAWQTKKDGDA